jgi:DNA repair photolyase
VDTDDDDVRKRFTPQAPPIKTRLKAISQLKEANLPVQVAVAPVLPFSNEFPKILSNLVDRIVVDDYTGDGSQGKRSGRLNVRELYKTEELDTWYGKNTYQVALEKLKQSLPSDQILISQEGFMPY